MLFFYYAHKKNSSSLELALVRFRSVLNLIISGFLKLNISMMTPHLYEQLRNESMENFNFNYFIRIKI
jgi:hypothetical protein